MSKLTNAGMFFVGTAMILTSIFFLFGWEVIFLLIGICVVCVAMTD